MAIKFTYDAEKLTTATDDGLVIEFWFNGNDDATYIQAGDILVDVDPYSENIGSFFVSIGGEKISLKVLAEKAASEFCEYAAECAAECAQGKSEFDEHNVWHSGGGGVI
jgi:hypothetical protein